VLPIVKSDKNVVGGIGKKTKGKYWLSARNGQINYFTLLYGSLIVKSIHFSEHYDIKQEHIYPTCGNISYEGSLKENSW
jgi:hypothetical protein